MPLSRRGSRSSTPRTSTGRPRASGFLGEILAGRRDRFVVRDEVRASGSRRPGPATQLARVPPLGRRGLARAAAHRRDRHLHAAPAGRRHAVAETVEALGELVREGKARYVGVSNVDVDADRRGRRGGAAHGGMPLVCVESRYSLIRRGAEEDVIPACERHGLGLLPYYPLESGLLTGKYRRGEDPPPDSRFVGNATVWPAERWLTDEAFDARRGARVLRRRARDPAARRRDRRPRRDARGRQRDRRGDDAGPGPGERPGGGSGSRPPPTWRRSGARVALARAYQANETVKPPSTTITWPVTYVAVSARK